MVSSMAQAGLTSTKQVQANCSSAPEDAQLSNNTIASTLADAGLEDIAIIDMRGQSERDCDTLILATGLSKQHAHAGALLAFVSASSCPSVVK